MTIWQAVLEAFESMSANKLRSALTMLGIVIGVAAVIAMLGVGSGAQETITGAIGGIGTNLLFVIDGNLNEEVRNPKPLSLADAQAIADPLQAPSVAAVAPIIDKFMEVTYEGVYKRTRVVGITPEYEVVRKANLLEGSFITQEQVLGRASVVIIGTEVADKLFGRRDNLIGESIRILGQPFRVIGVLASKGGTPFGSQDDVVLLPISTVRSRLIHRQRDEIDRIYVEAASANLVPQAKEEISQILRARHRILLGADDFTIMTQEDFLSMANMVTGTLTVFLGGIAGISLLVGGIGIMNIMLVSVTERTREIGLRKALGARNRDVLIQFLTESLLLSFVGGVIGIALGYLIAFIVARIAENSGTPFYPSITLQSILLSTLFSSAVGLFFGIYPASRAARLEPVEALRNE